MLNYPWFWLRRPASSAHTRCSFGGAANQRPAPMLCAVHQSLLNNVCFYSCSDPLQPAQDDHWDNHHGLLNRQLPALLCCTVGWRILLINLSALSRPCPQHCSRTNLARYNPSAGRRACGMLDRLCWVAAFNCRACFPRAIARAGRPSARRPRPAYAFVQRPGRSARAHIAAANWRTRIAKFCGCCAQAAFPAAARDRAHPRFFGSRPSIFALAARPAPPFFWQGNNT